ncbi:methylene-fatty-acyl-phospholipid synthase [Grosmannia clavigera kw1407]|uniref:Phosphatidyl-N-methylethanolamine N-methyltransferase n=1 Tax=Grosmannia clavigera (strain kw1407 / UAMH 11150) TaxID=655863 RepID=F0XLE4_GROCL|nr:methylene-fatty-acyl-phospholipid synthase [Grosmannia clavigera kw1407]EFX01209.1 methylene-fatty-acyl-phospholipid synthase [Grosmannia clavigera kw1407]
MASFADLGQLVDFNQTSLYFSVLAIVFNPTFWNIVARKEYRTHFLTRLFGGRARTACYFLAATIFSLGIVRDLLYERALRHQPTHPLLAAPKVAYGGYALLALGNVLVVSSTWRLGITGTFLGDYFGILLDSMVTGFPFNVTDAPMYYGSTMSFLGSALVYGRPAGVLLTVEVLFVYLIALRLENPFTAGIYAKREEERSRQAAVSKEPKKQR